MNFINNDALQNKNKNKNKNNKYHFALPPFVILNKFRISFIALIEGAIVHLKIKKETKISQTVLSRHAICCIHVLKKDNVGKI